MAATAGFGVVGGGGLVVPALPVGRATHAERCSALPAGVDGYQVAESGDGLIPLTVAGVKATELGVERRRSSGPGRPLA
jgi:hypothetical protein